MDGAKYEIAAQLDSDEQLLWSGMPRQGFVLRPIDAIFIPFGVIWCGGVLAWLIMASAIMFLADDPPPWFFPLMALPLLVLGLGFFSARYIVDARARARTFYGITNKRIIVIRGSLFRQVSSVDPTTLTDIEITEHANGSGTITFGPQHPMAWLHAGLPTSGLMHFGPPSLELIDDARAVYKIIRNTKCMK